MKDENNGAIMTEFVGLRAKTPYVSMVRRTQKKSKVSRVAQTIMFEDYMRCLFNEIEMAQTQSCIRSKLHEVYTISENCSKSIR